MSSRSKHEAPIRMPTPAAADSRRTARNRLRRRPDRGSHRMADLHEVLDAGLLCHVGYDFDGSPFVTPTAYWREGDFVYWHGSAASRMLKTQTGGVPVCFTVSHFDGLVLARSAFHHSVNYRSVMAFGTSEPVREADEKRRQLALFMERFAPGRWDQVRPPTARELRLTTVMRLSLDEAVLKTRSGPPKDDPADMTLDVWAGVLPIRTRAGRPVPDPALADGTAVPRGLQKLVTN